MPYRTVTPTRLRLQTRLFTADSAGTALDLPADADVNLTNVPDLGRQWIVPLVER